MLAYCVESSCRRAVALCGGLLPRINDACRLGAHNHAEPRCLRVQVTWHVWKHHTPLWQELLALVCARQGGDPRGPPADLAQRLLVRIRAVLA
jgi:hypothetical protein